jgi:heme exporter protein D
MIWNSPADFFAMGGYALYVWGSFGVCAVAMVLEPILVRQRRNNILQSLRRQALAEKLDKEIKLNAGRNARPSLAVPWSRSALRLPWY